MNKLKLFLLATLFVTFIAACDESQQKAAEEKAEEVVTEVKDAASNMISAAVTTLEGIREQNYQAAEVADEAPAAEAPASATVFDINTEDSKLTWRGKKVAYDHIGDIAISSGELAVEGGNIVAGNFEVDMSTLEDNTVEDPEDKTKLEGHLKSDDFFDVENYPTASLVITKAEPIEGVEGATHHISGNLQIKGVTKEVTFPAKVTVDGDKLLAEASFSIDRTVWEVNFNSGSVFTDLVADNIINDDINFYVYLAGEAEASRASAE